MNSRLLAGGLCPALLLACFFVVSSPPSLARSLSLHASTADQSGKPAPEAKLKSDGDPYLLDIDPVTCKSLGPIDKQVILVQDGREFRFATAKNADAFKAAPEKYIPDVDKRMVEQQLPLYPIDTCVVSGDKLGKQGATVDFIYRNRLVRLSSKDHMAAFTKEPQKFLALIDAAVIEKQKSTYKTTMCVVSDEKLGGSMGDPIDRVFGNRLVRFCCTSCEKDFAKDPLKYLAKLDGGGKEKGDKGGAGTGVSYTCPMHPEVVKDKPGACPKCGMDLIKKK